MEGNNEELVENIQHKLKVYVHIYTMWNKRKKKYFVQNCNLSLVFFVWYKLVDIITIFMEQFEEFNFQFYVEDKKY